MGKMVYLMGKSSSGKDTVYKRLLKDHSLHLKKVIPYTTRPIRMGEKNGEEYFFTDDDGFHKLQAQGRVIEARAYHTYHGLWRQQFQVGGGVDAGQDQVRFRREQHLQIGLLDGPQVGYPAAQT